MIQTTLSPSFIFYHSKKTNNTNKKRNNFFKKTYIFITIIFLISSSFIQAIAFKIENNYTYDNSQDLIYNKEENFELKQIIDNIKYKYNSYISLNTRLNKIKNLINKDNKNKPLDSRNQAPKISNENPLNNSIIRKDSLSFLLVNISDPNNNLINYTIQTTPNIGSQDNSSTGNHSTGEIGGWKICPISGFIEGTNYIWFVNVSDGTYWTNKTFSFIIKRDWWNDDWTYCKKITINHTLIDSDLYFFPVLIHNQSSSFCDLAQEDGDDFIFVCENNLTKYNHQIESYNPMTGDLICWVNITHLSSSKDTIFYMYYGNSLVENQQNINETWNSEYLLVHHYHNGLLNDSSSYGYHGDNTSYPTIPYSNGKIGGCVQLDEILDSRIYISDWANISSSFTAEMWIYIDESTTESYPRLFTEGIGYSLCDWCAYLRPGNPNNELRFMLNGNTIETEGNLPGTNGQGKWWYAAVRWDDIDDFVDIYVNDTVQLSEPCLDVMGNNYNYLIIGNDDHGNTWNGFIDEVRISSIKRNESWIEASYLNQHNPDIFVSYSNISSIINYTITINIEGNGSVIKTPDNSAYLYGDHVQLHAVPDDGWVFNHWNEDLSGSDNPINITVTDNLMITANFTKSGYTLNISIEGNGIVEKNPDFNIYSPNDTVELTAIPDPGWKFDHWKGNLSGNINPTNITMTENMSVTANFTQKQYTVTTIFQGNGTIIKNPDKSTYTYGEEVEITAIPDFGWSFHHWDGYLTGIINPKIITIYDNITIIANFSSLFLISDGYFKQSNNSSELRENSPIQDWYESRNANPDIVFLDTGNVGGNTGKKVGFYGFEQSNPVYLTQELLTPQTGVFSVSIDVFIDRVEDYQDKDRGGYIFLGDDSSNISGNSDEGKGPCSTSNERFVYLTFFDSGGTGSLELRAREYNAPLQPWDYTINWTLIPSTIHYATWHTITLIIYASNGTYDVYLDDVKVGNNISKYAGYMSDSIDYISISAGGSGRGDLYIDNILTPAIDTYNLDISTIGNGVVNVQPGEAKYINGTNVTLHAVPNTGWYFDHWEEDITGYENLTSLIIDEDKTVIAVFKTGNVVPMVKTENASLITNSSAVLQGTLFDDGGENCSVWFEWEQETDAFECFASIATGDICKDGRSILIKNRHYKYDYQRPRFFQGTNFTFFAVGNRYDTWMRRMGQNEKGLAMVSVDVYGSHRINQDKISHQSDRSSPNEDQDYQHVLGSYQTVQDAAVWLATHSRYHGNYGVIGSQPGVGAIICIDKEGNSNITWVNNSYDAIANIFVCNGGYDNDWGPNDYTAETIMRDIIENGTSSDGDNLLNWKDISRRIGKNTRDRELGTGTFYVGAYGAEIANGACRSVLVSIGGNLSHNMTNHMSWLAIGKYAQISIFLPIYAGNLSDSSDIPSEYGDADGISQGIQQFVDPKEAYASEGLSDNWYYCDRVREILRIANFNENITFDEFDNVISSISPSSNETEVKYKLANFVNETLPIALNGYINNISSSAVTTDKKYPYISSEIFQETIYGLLPGQVYSVVAFANNSVYSANGDKNFFITEPKTPNNLSANTYDNNTINLSWITGEGSNLTVIERNTYPTWQRGEGIEIYNGTGTNYSDISCLSGINYYYRCWSYTSKMGLFQYSSNSAFSSNITYGRLILLYDSEFNDSINSSDFRNKSIEQDWYESREDDPNLLTLDTSFISGNSGKKASLKNYGISKNAYLTQQFSAPQNKRFNVSMDLYVDRIEDSSEFDRTCSIYIGDNSITSNCPTGTSTERFVYLTIYDDTPGNYGDDLEIRARTNPSQTYDSTSQWTLIASDISYDTWFTLRFEIDVENGTYDVYLDDILQLENISKYTDFTSEYLTHISFVADSDGRGDYLVDNVFSPASRRYKLDLDVIGNGNISVDPGESTYAKDAVVQLTAIPNLGWGFDSWSGDLTGGTNPENIVMDDDKTVTATFIDIDSSKISNVDVLMSDPIDTDIGWENISCTVVDNVEVGLVYLNLTFPDMHTESLPMVKSGDTYYYNTSLSDVGTYSYSIWASDISGNTNSSVVDSFELPPNWDINVDHDCSIVDLILVANHFDEAGNNGWIREDVNNDGDISVLDLVLLVNHFDETW